MPRHDPAVIRRATWIARLAGAIVGLLAGISYGLYIIPNSSGTLSNRVSMAAAALLASGAMGLIFGVLVGPSLSVQPYLWLEEVLDTAPPSQLFGATVGLVVALLVGALVTVLLSGVPDGLGYLIALPFTCVLVYLCVSAGMRRRTDLAGLMRQLVRPGVGQAAAADLGGRLPPVGGTPVVLDTSVLIDGRVVDVAHTGFIPGRLLIPGFVLEELQRIADAGDPLRRAKGRRGLGVVEQLKQSRDVVCQIVDIDFPGTPEVDARLVRLARAQNAAIMTNDYMLNRIAQIEGVRVLNLNDLANAIKPIVSTGETMQVTIVKEGRELHQGVGYLEDGTMVVVENGRKHIDEQVSVTVTSVLQTAAGRLIFAQVPAGDERRRSAARGSATGRVQRIAKS